MTKSQYFIISNSGGDTYVQQMSEDELLKALNPDKHGDTELDFSKALASVAKADTNYWGDGFLIIKGEIIVPTAKQVVTQIVI